MKEPPRDDERERRITMEIVVDAYGPEEQAMGWHAYLDDHLGFPFRARCTTERATSTLNVGDVVDVVSMAPADECEHEMFVMIPRGRRRLAIPLAQIEGEDADPETRQAIDDWRYWVARGYEL